MRDRLADCARDLGIRMKVERLEASTRTVADAATAVGCDAAEIAKSIVFVADGDPVVCVASGQHRVDTAKVAAALGVAKLRRATPEFVRAHTGQAIGGVAPLGHPKPVRTLVDVDLAPYEVIWAAGGVPRAVFPISYDELVRVTAGTPTEVA